MAVIDVSTGAAYDQFVTGDGGSVCEHRLEERVTSAPPIRENYCEEIIRSQRECGTLKQHVVLIVK